MLPYGNEQMQDTETRIGIIGKMFSLRYSSLFRERRKQKEYEEWKAKQAKIKAQRADKTA